VPVAAPSVIRPAFLTVPAIATGNLSDEVAELAIQLGQQVEEEERIALGALTPVQSNGMPAGLEAGIVCGRRQIKSWALEMCTVHDAFVTKVHRVVWTAHLTVTSDDNFDHLTGLIESYDWLRKRVRRVYRGNGDHRIMLANGGRIEFTARESGKTGRGRDVNRLVLDEWLFGSPGMLGAMVPMLGGVQDRYIRYGSSPGLLKSQSLRDLRDRGRRGGDPSLSWAEWTSERMVDGVRVLPSCAIPNCSHLAGRVDGCFLDDEEIRRGVNPAYGRRLSPEFVEQERMAMPPVEFMRERGGVWEDPPTATTDDALANWPICADPTASPTGPLHLGIDVAPNMTHAAIGVCGSGPRGEVVEVIEHRPGTAWVPARLLELRAKHQPASVGLVKGSPAEALLPDLGDGVTLLTAADATAACATFARAVTDGTVAHLDDPRLNDAVTGARRKFAGDGWRWTRVGSDADICPLYAVTVARHLWATADHYDPLANFMPEVP
jgi:hypothetical protein